MRKGILLKIAATLVSMCIMLTSLSSCRATEEYKYYSQKENYLNATGIISNISYNKDSAVLYLELSELTPAFDDVCFKIVGDNLQIVQSNGIDNKIKIGDQIDFMTAPKYFGDGYVMPIVAIATNGESLLDFEEGYTNWLSWLSE